MDKREHQPSRWEELSLRASEPQLKLRAIFQSAAGALEASSLYDCEGNSRAGRPGHYMPMIW